ncbi:hypothetical protein EYF80_057671 [Liparis tanakae]|uniref:Uncharacterized protein n=1 Tax=Liparis tanakae TaxID=230148 RepID=A0A4Z2EU58_9TELE|nr:hypothetical protein EYF80_057671 [Liparis tanakae]
MTGNTNTTRRQATAPWEERRSGPFTQVSQTMWTLYPGESDDVDPLPRAASGGAPERRLEELQSGVWRSSRAASGGAPERRRSQVDVVIKVFI